MPRNLSVEQFQDLMRNIPRAVADELRSATTDQAKFLADTMKQAVPTGTDGRNELQESIRVEPGRRPLQAFVKAGGPLTTRVVRKGSGLNYDYALANEYGTRKMKAQPFFYPTYRLMKKKLRSAIQRRARKAIEKVVPLK
jgi:HK97 gp10 family phage protein